MTLNYTPSREEVLIRSIIDAKFAYHKKSKNRKASPPVVAMYRDYGAGGDHISRILAKKLGVNVYDKEILDSIAKAANVDASLMKELDDKVRKDKSAWVRGLFTTNTAYPASYRHHLVNVILGIAQTGGIIMGRAAHIILSDRKAFRVRVIGNEKCCAERIVEREAMSFESAQVKVASINQERIEFLREMFGVRLNENPSDFDLIINTDRFDNIDVSAEIILMAMVSMGFELPEQSDE